MKHNVGGTKQAFKLATSVYWNQFTTCLVPSTTVPLTSCFFMQQSGASKTPPDQQESQRSIPEPYTLGLTSNGLRIEIETFSSRVAFHRGKAWLSKWGIRRYIMAYHIISPWSTKLSSTKIRGISWNTTMYSIFFDYLKLAPNPEVIFAARLLRPPTRSPPKPDEVSRVGHMFFKSPSFGDLWCFLKKHSFFDVFIQRCSSRFEMVEKVMKILGQKGVS
jgi:hypothetical protein